MSLENLSEEQTNILNNILQGNHVIVDAVAGSGKSTVVLSIAEKIPNTSILQMTYNSMLRLEVKEKVENRQDQGVLGRVQSLHPLYQLDLRQELLHW